MAQRYGRKRRRAHLARIAELESASTRLVADTRRAEGNYERLLAHLDDWDRDVRHLLGPFSALQFKTPNLNTRGDPSEIERLPVPDQLRAMGPLALSRNIPEAIEMRIAWLHHMLFDVSEPNFGPLRTYMRLTITDTRRGRSESEYAFTEEYWRMLRDQPSERDITRLARDIARVMLAKAMAVQLPKKYAEPRS